jgi:hypothetical protein
MACSRIMISGGDKDAISIVVTEQGKTLMFWMLLLFQGIQIIISPLSIFKMGIQDNTLNVWTAFTQSMEARVHNYDVYDAPFEVMWQVWCGAYL